MELQKGRPKYTAGRLEKEIRTYDLLDKLGVAYERVDHEAAMTMEICQEIDKVLQATICKNLFLCNRQETKFYLLMIPDTKVFHTKDLSAQINSSRLSFAKKIIRSAAICNLLSMVMYCRPESSVRRSERPEDRPIMRITRRNLKSAL